jgi:hypothetical protein
VRQGSDGVTPRSHGLGGGSNGLGCDCNALSDRSNGLRRGPNPLSDDRNGAWENFTRQDLRVLEELGDLNPLRPIPPAGILITPEQGEVLSYLLRW